MNIVTYCHKVSLSQPQFIEQFFVQKFNFVIKDGRLQLSDIQANESLV